MLDEPAAGLNAGRESSSCSSASTRSATRGITLLVVEHNMDLVMNVAAARLRDGPRRAALRRHAARGAGQSARDRRLPRRRDLLLEVEGVELAYGEVPACRDVSFDVGAGRDRRADRRQRRGQEHHAARRRGRHAAAQGDDPVRRSDVTRLPAHQRTLAGIALVPEGRRVFPALTVRENLEMGGFKYRRDKRRSTRQIERMLEMFPRLRERAAQARRHALGRRAADARARPRADVGAAAPVHGRALARPRAAGRAGHLQEHPRRERRRHQRAAGRAERALRARDREPRLCAADRQHHRFAAATCAAAPGRIERVKEAYSGQTLHETNFR